MTRLASQGLAVDLPSGWDGRIGRRLSMAAAHSPSRAVMHLANFPLPEERGDFGSGAVDIMGPGGVMVVLFEHDPHSAGTALFRADGIPRRLRAEQLRRRLAMFTAEQQVAALQPLASARLQDTREIAGPLLRLARAESAAITPAEPTGPTG